MMGVEISPDLLDATLGCSKHPAGVGSAQRIVHEEN